MKPCTERTHYKMLKHNELEHDATGGASKFAVESALGWLSDDYEVWGPGEIVCNKCQRLIWVV